MQKVAAPDSQQQPIAGQAQDRLALYHFDSCPYCARVRQAIEHLGIDVELRDIRGDRQHYRDLVEARGVRTVPVLKIDGADGSESWLPESADIVRYLEELYG